MGSARSYVRSVWDQTRHVAAWIPLSKVELGEIYKVHKGVPQLVGTLADWGIEWKEDPESEKRGNWTAKSERGVDISTKFEGKTPDGIVLKNLAVADAGAVVKFTEKDSYVISLSDVTMQRMENTTQARAPAAQAVLQAVRQLGHRLVGRDRGVAGAVGHVPDVVDRARRRSSSRPTPRSRRVASRSPIWRAASRESATRRASDDFVGQGQISPMFKAVKLKIGGIGPAGVRSFDVDPEQLPEERAHGRCRGTGGRRPVPATATTTRSSSGVRAAVVVGCDGYGSANASLAGAVRDALAFWRWVCDPTGGGVTDENARRLLLSPSEKGVCGSGRTSPPVPPTRRRSRSPSTRSSATPARRGSACTCTSPGTASRSTTTSPCRVRSRSPTSTATGPTTRSSSPSS